MYSLRAPRTILRDSAAKLVQVGRFHETVCRPELQRPRDHRFPAGRDAHDRYARRQCPLRALHQERQPVHDGHHQIEHDQAGPAPLEHLQPCQAIVGGENVVAGTSEGGSFDLSDVGIIFDDENGCHRNTKRRPSGAVQRLIRSNPLRRLHCGTDRSQRSLLIGSCLAGGRQNFPTRLPVRTRRRMMYNVAMTKATATRPKVVVVSMRFSIGGYC